MSNENIFVNSSSVNNNIFNDDRKYIRFIACPQLPVNFHKYRLKRNIDELANLIRLSDINGITANLKKIPKDLKPFICAGYIFQLLNNPQTSSDRIIVHLTKLCPESVGIPGTDGNIPLHCAVTNRKLGIAVIQELMTADRNSCLTLNIFGVAPIHTVISSVDFNFEKLKIMLHMCPQAIRFV